MQGAANSGCLTNQDQCTLLLGCSLIDSGHYMGWSHFHTWNQYASQMFIYQEAQQRLIDTQPYRGQRKMSGPPILFTLCLIPLRQSLSLNPALMWFFLSLPSSVLAYQGMWPHSAFYVGTRIWTCLQVCKARTLTYWPIFAVRKSFFLTKHKTKALYF